MKWLGLVVLLGCSSPAHSLKPDGAAQDGAVDSAVDAAVDAPADAVPDAHVSGFSSSCTTAPTMLVDTSPRIIGNMARAADTLYVSAYQLNNDTTSDYALYSIDLATGVVGTPAAIAANLGLWPGGDNVYGADGLADGTIWQLHPGDAPLALVQHVANVTTVAADADYVYWGDKSNMVSRRLIAGGAIESVMPCANPTRLVIDGTDLYCAAGSTVVRGLKAGGSIPDGITTMITNYPITSMHQDGTSIFYVNLDPMPDLLEIKTFGSSATVINKLNVVGRYAGLAISADAFYIADLGRGLRKIDRATETVQTIVASLGVSLDPVLWNHDLFYEDQNPQLSGERYVMHCVD